MRLARVAEWPNGKDTDYRPELEAGNILFFAATPFPLPMESQEFLRSLYFAGGAIHKNIAYRPASGRLTGIQGSGLHAERVRSIMQEYSRAAVQFAAELLPDYARKWKVDYASFRPLEEQGRDLPTNKRNDLIHTDAFPSRPTNGDLILRIFTNIHPSRARMWTTTDAFPVIAEQYARGAGLEQIAARTFSPGGRLAHRSARLMQRLGAPIPTRSAYDRFMLRFHDYLKQDDQFQAKCNKYSFEFPAGSTWLAFTDIVPHSVQSGQHALEQTFIVPRTAMANMELAPIAILERLCGKRLLAE